MSLEGKSSKNGLFAVRLTVRVDLVRVPNPLALALQQASEAGNLSRVDPPDGLFANFWGCVFDGF